MRNVNPLLLLVILLAACGLSFGAGWFIGQGGEPALPNWRQVASNDDTNQGGPGGKDNTESGNRTDEADEGVTITLPPVDEPLTHKDPETNPGPDAENDPDAPTQPRGSFELPGNLPGVEIPIPVPFPPGGEDNAETERLITSVSGTVVDQNGIPVPGAQIRANYSQAQDFNGGGMRFHILQPVGERGKLVAVSDSAGMFRFDADVTARGSGAVSGSIWAEHDEFAPSEHVNIRVRDGEQRDGIRLVVRRPGGISGRVVDENGVGVAGVLVSIGRHGTGFSIPGMDDAPVVFGPGADLPPAAVTGPDGEYEWRNLPEGEYTLTVTGPGWRQISGPTSMRVRAGHEHRASPNFIMVRETSVQGRILDEAGDPVTAQITITIPKLNLTRHVRPDEDGFFALNLPNIPAEAYEIGIEARGYAKVERYVMVIEGRMVDIGVVQTHAVVPE